MIDPEDGLPIADDVHDWALEKHQRLEKYVDITRKTRAKFTDPSRPMHYRGGTTYIDLFCGPGRAKVIETGRIVDGSPLVAFKSAKAGDEPYSEMHLADVDPAYSAAAIKRISKLGGNSFGYTGRAENTVKEIVGRLNPNGLHFAFLDPYNLANLSFETIRSLAKVKRIDLLMHVSVQDLQRNSDRYTSEEYKTFDLFAPGWRNAVDLNQGLKSIRAGVLVHWKSLVQGLGFLDMRSMELITGTKKQRLYWLAFVSRHKIANDFWDKIRNISGQREFGL